MSSTLPGAAGDLAARYPDLWKAYAALGKACAEAGPLTDRERRLVKLALAIGAGSEGAVHSHSRRARSEGIDEKALEQVALLAIGPLGLPRAVAAKTWIEDTTA
jgi:alkylhydroperoxidase/carboxymuconolactone decarboxylase family protein YurZ